MRALERCLLTGAQAPAVVRAPWWAQMAVADRAPGPATGGVHVAAHRAKGWRSAMSQERVARLWWSRFW